MKKTWSLWARQYGGICLEKGNINYSMEIGEAIWDFFSRLMLSSRKMVNLF